jgi:hypothetical protein
MSMKLEQQQENESTPDVITLLTPLQLGALSLPNRIVMSPMTRARSTDGVPTDIEVKYYSQRASAGLIITAGIYISRMAVGGMRKLDETPLMPQSLPNIRKSQCRISLFSSHDLGQNDFCRSLVIAKS